MTPPIADVCRYISFQEVGRPWRSGARDRSSLQGVQEVSGSRPCRQVHELPVSHGHSHRGMSGNQSSSVVASSTVAGLANLAVRAGSGCPPRGVQEGREVDPAQPPAQVLNAADEDVSTEFEDVSTESIGDHGQ
jgi:hypothetical protein